jgi:hypothetical protein
VLNSVHDTINSTLEQVKRHKDVFAFKGHTPTGDDDEVVGRCLLASFAEQLGQMLIPSDPGTGVFLLSNRQLRGRLEETSVLKQNVMAARTRSGGHECGLFITMNATLIPSGNIHLRTAPSAHTCLINRLDRSVGCII